MVGKNMNKDYEKYLDEWLCGLEEEIEFWKSYMETQGDIYADDFQNTISKNKRFTLEEDMPKNSIKTDVKFIDVGSGPFSRCGQKTDKVNLVAMYIDPLAEVYNLLKTKYSVDNGAKIKAGFVELLDKEFTQNSFDLVHMSNSLDHSFDAVFGIYQLLFICKIGGKVILRHAENEAERSEYQGLHQWNLSVHKKEGSFVIWRDDKLFDIGKCFQEYADVEIYSDLYETSGWKYNKVILTKKKNIKIPDNTYYQDMLNKTYSFLLRKLYDEVNNRPSQKEIVINNRRAIEKILEFRNNKQIFVDILRREKIESVDLYGFGVVGKELYELLEACGVKVVNIIDAKENKKHKTITLNELDECKESSKIIVAVLRDLEDINRSLIEKGYASENIFGIEALLSRG